MGLITRAERWGVMERVLVFNFLIKCVEKERGQHRRRTRGGEIGEFLIVQKQRRFFEDNLMFCVQLVDVSTKCSSHSQGKSEARCDNAGALQVWLLCLYSNAVQFRGQNACTNVISTGAFLIEFSLNFFMSRQKQLLYTTMS